MVYTLISLIGPETFDFNRFDKNLDAKAFLNDNSILPCDCTGFLFVAKDDNHITAVDLRVVVSNTLFKHFSKGPKYRENRIADYQKANKS